MRESLKDFRKGGLGEDKGGSEAVGADPGDEGGNAERGGCSLNKGKVAEPPSPERGSRPGTQRRRPP